MIRHNNRSGMVFGRLTVLKKDEVLSTNVYTKWLCKCKCGRVVSVLWGNLAKKGHTTSCGCFNKESTTKHGQCGTSEYVSWQHMLRRCDTEGESGYDRYGGKGVKVCKRWIHSFSNFYKDMGPKPSSSHTIDRYPDKKGDYEPSNCRWATKKEQAQNISSNVWFENNGVEMVLADWAKEFGVRPRSIKYHISKGKTFSWVYNHFKIE